MKGKRSVMNDGANNKGCPEFYREGEPLGRQVLRARGQEEMWESWLNEHALLENDALPEDFFADPFDLKDMAAAVELLEPLIAERRPILIHGDYDCDGLTATALLCRYLSARGVPVDYYIPDRMNEGYGLSSGGVDYACKTQAAALITVDCGVQSFAEVKALETAGIPVVVSDHHSCLEELPAAHAVVNPNRRDEDGRYAMLAGAGVALKLIQALDKRRGGETLWQKALQYAALGTVSDLMLLLGENRRIVLAGIRQLRQSPDAGLAALLELLRVAPEKLSAKTLGFSLGPRINACGRMGSVEAAIRLLLTDEVDEARQAALELDRINGERRAIEGEVFRQALGCLQKNPQRLESRILLVDGTDWHTGVLGIVATRLSERLQRPTIVLSRENDENYRGSARSVGQVNILTSIQKCGELLEKFGGHEKAAGLELRPEKLEGFRLALEEAARALPLQALEAETEPLLQLPPQAISLEQAESLAVLEPFGRGNPEPLFGLDGLCVRESRAIGQEGAHLRLVLADCALAEAPPITAVAFSQGQRAMDFGLGQAPLLEAHLQLNLFRGQKSPQLIVRSLKPAVETTVSVSETLERLYASFPSWTAAQLAAPLALPPAALLPEAEALRELYRKLIKSGLNEGPFLLDAAQTAGLCPDGSPKDASLRLFIARRCLEIFEQAGLLSRLRWNETPEPSAELFCYYLQTPAHKVNLYETPCYQRLQN